jgi:hypothetical protein
MNERIRELEKQAWGFVDKTWNWANANNPSQATLFKAKFAELIVNQCADIAQQHNKSPVAAPLAIGYVIREHFGVEE